MASITTRAQQPAHVETGEEFSFTGATITVEEPRLSEIIRALDAATVRGSITSFAATVTNATPASLNLADSATFSSGLPFEAPVEPGREVVLVAPSEERTSTWGQLTVTGKDGQTVTITPTPGVAYEETESGYKATGKGIVIQLSSYNSEGRKTVGPLELVCNPPAATLASATIVHSPNAPTVTSVRLSEPPGACSDGEGYPVEITGTHFTGVTAVDFGSGHPVGFRVASEDRIEVTAPPGSGTVNVTVTSSEGISEVTPADQFSYLERPGISSVEPSHGPAAGGTIVTLKGSGFRNYPIVGLQFGSQSATFHVISQTEMTAVTPAGAGTVPIRISTPACSGYGPSFTYEPSPIERLAFTGWALAGSITPKPLAQAITLPAGSSFNGSGELNTETGEGTVTGAISVAPFKAAPKLLGLIPVSLGMTITQYGAISGSIVRSKTISGDEALTLPVKLNLGFTSVGLLGLNVPTKCSTSQPVSLTLTDTLTKEALLTRGWSFSGATTIPKISCEGGLLGALYGETLSGLISGAGALYSLNVSG